MMPYELFKSAGAAASPFAGEVGFFYVTGLFGPSFLLPFLLSDCYNF
jgi:hypothetical protein